MSAQFPAAFSLPEIEALFEPLADCPFFIKDSALRYAAANPAMAQLCGVGDPARLIGRSSADFFPADLARRFDAFDREILETGRAMRSELALARSRGGQPAWLMFTRRPVHDSEGKVIGVVASARRLDASAAVRRRGGGSAAARLARVAETLKAGFAGPLDLAGLAAIAGTSPSQLERDWKRLFGRSPGGFQHRLRIDHALDLLAGPLPVAQVALACGYTDQSAFARRFRAETGMTPSGYRKRLSG